VESAKAAFRWQVLLEKWQNILPQVFPPPDRTVFIGVVTFNFSPGGTAGRTLSSVILPAQGGKRWTRGKAGALLAV